MRMAAFVGRANFPHDEVGLAIMYWRVFSSEILFRWLCSIGTMKYYSRTVDDGI